MTASDRSARTQRADELCAKAFSGAGCPESGVALVAVGGYGREELAPYSDLDVVLVHDPDVRRATGRVRSGTRCGTPARPSTTPCAR